MNLTEETQILTEALPIEAFRAHLRMGTGFAEESFQDAVLEGYLRAAIAAVEARTGKAILSRQFGLTLDCWRLADQQALPVAPVSAVLSVTITDRFGSEEAVDSSLYQLVADQHRPLLRAVGASLPMITSGGTVTILFSAGFATWADVPEDLKQAVFLLAAHYYEFRNETSLTRGCMPFGVTSLLERYLPRRLGLGERL